MRWIKRGRAIARRSSRARLFDDQDVTGNAERSGTVSGGTKTRLRQTGESRRPNRRRRSIRGSQRPAFALARHSDLMTEHDDLDGQFFVVGSLKPQKFEG